MNPLRHKMIVSAQIFKLIPGNLIPGNSLRKIHNCSSGLLTRREKSDIITGIVRHKP